MFKDTPENQTQYCISCEKRKKTGHTCGIINQEKDKIFRAICFLCGMNFQVSVSPYASKSVVQEANKKLMWKAASKNHECLSPLAPQPKDSIRDWEKEFDEKFVEDHDDWWLTYYERDQKTSRNAPVKPSNIKSFISKNFVPKSSLLNLIEEERKEEVFWIEVENQIGVTLNIGNNHTYIENRLNTDEMIGIKKLIIFSLNQVLDTIKAKIEKI